MKTAIKLGLEIFEASTAIVFATVVVILTLLAGAGVKAAEPTTPVPAMTMSGTIPSAPTVHTALANAGAVVGKAAEETNQVAEAAGKALLSRWEILKAAAVKEIETAAVKVEPEVVKAIEAAAASKVKEQETLTALLQAVEKAVK